MCIRVPTSNIKSTQNRQRSVSLSVLLPIDNMKFKRIILLLIFSNIWILDLQAASITTPGLSTRVIMEKNVFITDANGSMKNFDNFGPRQLLITKNIKTTPRSSMAIFFQCLVQKWYSDDGKWKGCYDFLLPVWNPTEVKFEGI